MENPNPPTAATSDVNDKPQVVSGDDLAAPLVEGMPEPTASSGADDANRSTVASPEPGPRNYAPETPPPVNEYPHVKDAKGRAFDPSLYRTNDDGTPKLNKNGFFVSNKAGRPSLGENAEPHPQTTTKIPGGNPSPAMSVPVAGMPDKFELAARGYVKAGTNGLAALISDEWQLESKEEETWLTGMVADYLRASNAIDLSPGWVLTLGLVAYSGKRYNMPKTQEKVKTWTQKIKAMFNKEKP